MYRAWRRGLTLQLLGNKRGTRGEVEGEDRCGWVNKDIESYRRLSNKQGITESLELEETSGDYLLQPSCQGTLT